MSEPRNFGWQGRGMLLLQSDPVSVSTWAHRGLVPVHVVPLDGWTAVLPAGPSHALPPYDNALKILAGRPVPSRLRSAIGIFTVDGNVVISAHPGGWRADQTWFMWSPGTGVVAPPRLAAGKPADLIAAAGISRSGRGVVQEVLRDGGGDTHGFVSEMMALLALPGSELLDGSQDPEAMAGSIVIQPGAQHVARFQRIINDEARHRAEMEEG